MVGGLGISCGGGGGGGGTRTPPLLCSAANLSKCSARAGSVPGGMEPNGGGKKGKGK